jgi:hypothetical protein
MYRGIYITTDSIHDMTNHVDINLILFGPVLIKHDRDAQKEV